MSTEIEIFVAGQADRWVFSKSRVRIGQEINCDLILSKVQFPSAEGVQLLIEAVNGAIRLVEVRGNASLNAAAPREGTILSVGDRVRFGADGAEISFRLVNSDVSNAPASGYVATSVMEGTLRDHEPTRVMDLGDTDRIGMDARHGNASPTLVQQHARRQGYGAETVSSMAPALSSRTPEKTTVAALPSHGDGLDRQVRSATPGPPPSRTSTTMENEMMASSMQALEGKVKGMRVLLVINMVVVLALLGLIFQMQQQLSKNSQDLGALRVQAQSAVGQFTPALDSRLSLFEQRMDGLDAKMKIAQEQMISGMDAKAKMAEDRLVERMNAEIPRMLDKYIEKRMLEIKH